MAYFLNSANSQYNENLDEEFIEQFSHLDDYDIFASAKEWMGHSDSILADLSSRLIERKLFKIRIDDQPFEPNELVNFFWLVQNFSDVF